MLKSNKLKAMAKSFGADVVGVANLERFKEAPPHNHPACLLPEARAVIVIGRRVLRGLHRPIEEGTGWHAYNMFGYGGLSIRYCNEVVYRLACHIEDLGYQAVPHSAHTIWNYHGLAKNDGGAGPEVCVTLYYAAYAAGLGEMGWSKVFLNPEYGPMLRYALVITDAPYEPDPLFEGKICDRCKICVKKCPAGAIAMTKSQQVAIGNKEVVHCDLNTARCLFYHWGLSRKVSPFLPDDLAGEYQEGMTMDDVVKLREKVNARVPIYNRIRMDSHTQAICGSRGCSLACVRHLEEKGLISKKMRQFTQPARQAPRAVITNRKIFLPGERIPKNFIAECKKDGKGALSLHCEGVG